MLALSEHDSCQSALSPPCFLFSHSQTIDQLSGIQAELQESVKELAKAKKKYYDCEQVAHAVREKADIEAKWVHHNACVYLCIEIKKSFDWTDGLHCQKEYYQEYKVG